MEKFYLKGDVTLLIFYYDILNFSSVDPNLPYIFLSIFQMFKFLVSLFMLFNSTLN